MFHIDKKDWLEDNLQGKNTSQYLQMRIFKEKYNIFFPIKLNIYKEETE